MSNLEEIPPEDEARTYRAQSYGRRVRMVFAGPAMNLLIALVLFIGFFAFHEERIISDPRWPAIDAPGEGSPAAIAGLQAGDRILRHGRRRRHRLRHVPRRRCATCRARPSRSTIERSGEPMELQVTLGDRNPGTGERGIGFLGVSPGGRRRLRRSATCPRRCSARSPSSARQVGGTVVGIGRIFSPAGLTKLWQTVSGERPGRPDAAGQLDRRHRAGGRSGRRHRLDLLRRAARRGQPGPRPVQPAAAAAHWTAGTSSSPPTSGCGRARAACTGSTWPR